MIKMIVKITHVDYEAIAGKVIPAMVERMSSQGKLPEPLRKLGHMPSAVVSSMLKLLSQSAKDEIAVNLIQSNSQSIIDSANRFMQDRDLPLAVREIQVSRLEAIHLSLYFDEVDYAALILAAYDNASENAGQDDKFEKLQRIINHLDKKSEKLMGAALSSLNQSEADSMVAEIIGTYENEILTVINKMADDNGLKLTFGEISTLPV